MDYKTFINKEELHISNFLSQVENCLKKGDSRYKQLNWQISPPNHIDTDGQLKYIFKLLNTKQLNIGENA